jgi:regulator of protease activity HflC (stomatin/prohibitin superfamily)
MAFERYVNQADGAKQGKLWVIGIIALIVIIIIWNGFVVVPAGHMGVVLRFGAVKGSIDPGLHLLIPFVEKVEALETREMTYNFRAETFSKQQQDVLMEIVVLYQLNREYVEYIYETFGNMNEVVKKIIVPSTEQVIKSVASQFDTTTIHLSRGEIKTQCEMALNTLSKNAMVWESKDAGVTWKFKVILGETDEMINSSHETKKVMLNGKSRVVSIAEKDEKYELVYFLDNIVMFKEVNITNISYSDAYTQAIEDKQIAQQRVEKADRELDEAKTRKEIAKTQAEAKKIEQELISASLSPAILQSRWIDKWNGILPSVMGGDSGGLILDIGALSGK